MKKKKTSRKGVADFHIFLPKDLHSIFAKLCIDAGITKTKGIVYYLEYLADMPPETRELIMGPKAEE